MNQKITFCRECTQLEPQKVQDSETTRFKWDLNWAKSLPCLPWQVPPLAFVLTVSVHCWPFPPFHSLSPSHTHAETHILARKPYEKESCITPKEVALASPLRMKAVPHSTLSSEILNGHGCSLGDQEWSRWGQMIYRIKQLYDYILNRGI